MSAPENIYRVDDLMIDCENFRVQKGEQDIALTPRAFDVFIFLLKNAGRVVEKQEIFDAVWKDTFVGDNALTKIIKEIRHALNDDANKPHYIETVPKRGYRFVADVTRDSSNENDRLKIEPFALTDSNKTIPLPTAKRKNFLLIGVVILSLTVIGIGFLAFTEWYSEIAVRNAPIDSIAVLPFENVSADQNIEYFSDGITENIINTLSRLPNLRVVPRSTVFYYKGKSEDPHTVGRILRVRAVLTGRIIQRGESLSIQTELIDIDRKAQIWGQHYSRPLTDVISLKQEITNSVIERLGLQLTHAERQKLARRETESNEAYQLYNQGLYHWNKFNGEGYKKAIEYFQKAIDIDPNYSLAHASMGIAIVSLSLANDPPPLETFPKARSAVTKALAIDDTLAEAHSCLGTIKFFFDWDWNGAEQEFQRALSLNPNLPEAHLFYAILLSDTGQHEQALSMAQRSRDLSPLALRNNALEGQFLFYAGKNDDSLTKLQKAIEYEPNFWLTRLFIARAYIEKGMYSEAVAEATQARDLSRGANTEAIALMIYALAKSGKIELARSAMNELKRLASERYIPPYHFALAYNGLNKTDETFAWLEKAYQARDLKMTFLKVEPKWNNLRGDARFVDLMKRMNLQ